MKYPKQKLNFVINYKDVLDLFVISFISLFFEMIFIRWIPSKVHVVGFFTNFVLIACFLGLSAGCITAYKKSNMIYLFPLLLMGIALLITHLGKFSVTPLKEDYIFEAPTGTKVVGLYSLLMAVFVFITVTFIPLGHELGKCMSKFKPLVAYIINISGSILGVVCFTIISFLCLQPIVWFGLGMFLLLWLFRKKYTALLFNSILMVISFYVLYPKEVEIWSPYYKINVIPIEKSIPNRLGYFLTVNNQYHQYILNFGESLYQTGLSFWEQIYSLPYFLNPNIKDVLILGAGTGNDAAIALKMGAENIDAVEIDPMIAKLGKKLHPQGPYQNPRVNMYITGFTFFSKNANKKYDLITLGTLDSHTLFSSMSTLRLDSYTYTKESFQEIKKHLKSTGMVAVMMGVPKPWIGNRIYQILKDVFKSDVNIYYTENPFGILVFVSYMDSSCISKSPPRTFEKIDPIRFQKPVVIATDDWPYFYMEDRIIPDIYLKILLSILILSIILIFVVTPAKKKSVDLHFFFLGGAFMSVETKCITELGLLFEPTWIVNSITIPAILVMILLANLYVQKVKISNTNLYYFFLIGVIIFIYLLPLQKIFISNVVLRMIISGTIVALPLLFAAIIFAQSFKRVENIYVSFGSNLLGSAVGGICEYISLIYGLKTLYIVALIMYLLSWRFSKTYQMDVA